MNLDDYVVLSGRIQAIEPLHIGFRSPIGNFVKTLDYIPARSIRGMLGNYLHEERAEVFKDLGIGSDDDPPIYFKVAMPEGGAFVPMDIRWCKKCSKAVFNNENLCRSEGCIKIRSEGKKHTGIYNKKRMLEDYFLEAVGVKKTTNTKCPIDPETLTSYQNLSDGEGEKSPYNIEAILPGTRFDLKLVVPEDIVSDLKDYLREAGVFYGVGGFRSRGYGSIYVNGFSTEGAEEYISRRADELSDDGDLYLVLNSPTIFKVNDNRVEVGFGEAFRRDILSRTRRKEVSFSDAHFRETVVKGWNYKGTYALTEIYHAMDGGSTCKIDLEAEEAAFLELTGLGYNSHIYGDVYFYRRSVV